VVIAGLLSALIGCEASADELRVGGMHLLAGAGAGARDGIHLRSSVELGAALTTAGRPPEIGLWSVGGTSGLLLGAAWSQGLDALRGETYAEIGWQRTWGYAGGMLVVGPAVRWFGDLGVGGSARGCLWAWAVEACLRGTGTYVGRVDGSLLLLVGLGIN
jgi:hypothetical protein